MYIFHCSGMSVRLVGDLLNYTSFFFHCSGMSVGPVGDFLNYVMDCPQVIAWTVIVWGLLARMDVRLHYRSHCVVWPRQPCY